MLKKHPSKNPLRGLIPFLTDAAINIPSLRDSRGFLKSSRFLCKIRFGWETEPTGLGSEAVVIAKIDTYGFNFTGNRNLIDVTSYNVFALMKQPVEAKR